MLKFWDRAEQTLAGLLGLAALALALWQVVSRYMFPGQAISFAEEVIVYLMIWAIMIVSSQLVRTDSHVRPDLVLNVAWRIDERSASDLRFPMWLYYAALPAGGALMLLRYVIRLAVLAFSPGWSAVLSQHPGSHELPSLD